MPIADFNDAGPQRVGGDLIPDKTVARVIGTIRPGGANREGQDDGGFLTASKNSDVLYLSFEFTVVDGPFARRKFWQNMTVSGGEVNEHGESKAWNITKSTVKAMLNSAHGLMPDDTSETARRKRVINSWDDLAGLEFVCRVRVVPPKPGTTYQAQNQIGQVIEPDHKEYAPTMSGVAVAHPSPVAAPAAGPAPGWAPQQQATKPAAASAPLPSWAR
jgi:hypothetical protein